MAKEATTRVTHVRKFFRGEDGVEKRSAFEGWAELVFQLVKPTKDAEGNFVPLEEIVVKPADVPEAMQYCAVGYGLSQKIGDSYASLAKMAKDEGITPDEKTGLTGLAKQIIEDELAALKNGIWVAESEGGSGGSNTTILLEAIMRAHAEAGDEFTPERKAETAKKLADKETRDKARKVPQYIAAEAAIKSERAEARRKAAAEAAKKAEPGSLTF